LCYGQEVLVGNKGGQWIIYSGKEKITLPNSFYEVGNFDNRNLTSFGEHGKYGILNASGAVVAPPSYYSINQLGGGIYLCVDEQGQTIVDFTQSSPNGFLCKNATKLTKSWRFVEMEKEHYLFNIKNGARVNFKEGDTLLNYGFDHIYVRLGAKNRLYSPAGDTVQMDGNYPRFSKFHLDITTIDGRVLVFNDRQFDLPHDARYVKIVEDELIYSSDGRSYIVNTVTGEEIFSADYDNITRFGIGYFLAYKNNKVGIVRADGTVICPPKYNFITDSRTHYTVYQSGGTGAMDKSGNEIVPCVYRSVKASPAFFNVTSELGFQGIYSRKTNRLLIDCAYDRIDIRDNKIRAWSGDKLRIFEIDKNHAIIHTLTLANAITLHTRHSSKRQEQIDERLFSLGWYTETIPRFDSLGFKVGEIHKWGLKGANDSIILKARHLQPKFIPNAEFSLVPRKKMKTQYAGLSVEINASTVIDFTSGKMLLTDAIYSIDTMDLMTRNYSRFVGGKGPGILKEQGKVFYVDFIDGYDSEFVRFCKAKNKKVSPADKGDSRAVRLPNIDLNDDPAIKIDYRIGSKNFSHIVFEDAEWNYLDTAGNVMFENPFEFAEQFHRQTAIVKRNGRFGVVSEDSMVIKSRYHHIERATDFSDTLFIVKSIPNGTRYLDTLTKELSDITKVMKRSGDAFQIQTGKTKKIIDSDYRVVSGDSKAQKWMGNGFFYTRSNKEFLIYDAFGINVATCRGKPDKVLNEQFILMKSHSRFGLLDFLGDTILPFSYKLIDEYGPYILAGDGSVFTIYDAQMSAIKKVKTSNILVDVTSGNIAIYNEGKCSVINPQGKTLKKYANFKPEVFHGGVLVAKGSGKTIENIHGEGIEVSYTIKNIEVMDGHGFLIEDRDRHFHVYTAGLKKLLPDSLLDRVNYVGEGYVMARSEKGMVLFSDAKVKWSRHRFYVQGTFNDGLILVKDGVESSFLDVNLENEFGRIYSAAMPFNNGYASVKGVEGWTIIDRRGYPKSLPAFDQIEPLGNNLFSTKKQAVYGLFDSHGNVLLPVEFQQINFLKEDLIQGVKQGEIFYFHRNGNPIEL
jgi:hypothetical protein